jgi:uncharacterized OB-fold protein
MTTVRIPVVDGLTPPYVLALVELDEGPRLLTNVVGPCEIENRVEVTWARRDGLVVPIFHRAEDAANRCSATASSEES